MSPEPIQNGFVQVALPIMIAIVITTFMNLKKLDSIRQKLETIGWRLDEVARIQERTSLIQSR